MPCGCNKPKSLIPHKYDVGQPVIYQMKEWIVVEFLPTPTCKAGYRLYDSGVEAIVSEDEVAPVESEIYEFVTR